MNKNAAARVQVAKTASTKKPVLAKNSEPKKRLIDAPYRDKYKEFGGSNGDALAKILKSYFSNTKHSTEKAIALLCKENGIATGTGENLANIGLRIMVIRNILRGRVRRNEKVSVDGVVVETL